MRTHARIHAYIHALIHDIGTRRALINRIHSPIHTMSIDNNYIINIRFLQISGKLMI